MSRIVTALFFAAVAANAQVNIAVDRNTGDAARAEFKFERVPPPSAIDAAARADVVLVAVAIDAASGGLAALNDGPLFEQIQT